MKSSKEIEERIQEDLANMLAQPEMYVCTPEALIMGVYHDISLLAFIWEKEPPSFRGMGLDCGFGVVGDNRVLFPDDIEPELVEAIRAWVEKQPPHPLERLAGVTEKTKVEPSK